MQERKTDHILLCLACERMAIGVKCFQKKNWVIHPDREWCTRAKQLMKEFASELDTSLYKIFVLELDNLKYNIWTGVIQLPTNECCSLELDNSQWINVVEII